MLVEARQRNMLEILVAGTLGLLGVDQARHATVASTR
jgi:hypothetical protein